jgi:hypothetical protein
MTSTATSVAGFGEPPTAPQRAAAAAPVETVESAGVQIAARDTTRQAVQRLERVHFGLLIGGSVLLPLGLLVIGLGWYGAAHTPYAFEQTPYLISGGVLGVALVLAGGFLYFGAWMVRASVTARRDADRVVEALDRITALLPAISGGPAPQPVVKLVATRTGSMVHRADCPIVANRGDLRPVSSPDGLKPCRLCEPLGPQA